LCTIIGSLFIIICIISFIIYFYFFDIFLFAIDVRVVQHSVFFSSFFLFWLLRGKFCVQLTTVSVQFAHVLVVADVVFAKFS